MKSQFITLFKYDKFANFTLLEALIQQPEKQSVRIMAHLLTAQQVWLSRCKNQPFAPDSLWPDWPVETLQDIITKNSNEWLIYLYTLQTGDFDKTIHYRNMQGVSFETRLVDILTQVTNHGTHHRGQIGMLLKISGLENLPNTDYITYARQFNN